MHSVTHLIVMDFAHVPTINLLVNFSKIAGTSKPATHGVRKARTSAALASTCPQLLLFAFWLSVGCGWGGAVRKLLSGFRDVQETVEF